MIKEKIKRFIPKSIAGRIFLAFWLVFLLVLLGIFSVPCYHYFFYSPKEGDLVFQSLSRNPLVNAIEGVSGSPYSHCGIVIKKNGSWQVFEAIGPVKETSLFSWIMRGRRFDIDVYRLKPEYREHIPKMIAEARKFTGKPYDIHYRMDDENIYCSELIYKGYKQATGAELGTLTRLRDLNWKPYKKTIEYFEKGQVPMDRKMVTPVSIAKSPLVERIK